MCFYFKNVDPKSLHFLSQSELCFIMCLSQLGRYPQQIFPTFALCKNWHLHQLQRPQIIFFKTFIAVRAVGGNVSENEVYLSILLYLYCTYLRSSPIFHHLHKWARLSWTTLVTAAAAAAAKFSCRQQPLNFVHDIQLWLIIQLLFTAFHAVNSGRLCRCPSARPPYLEAANDRITATRQLWQVFKTSRD